MKSTYFYFDPDINADPVLFCLETVINISKSIFTHHWIRAVELCEQSFTKHFFNNYDAMHHKVGQVRS